MPIISSQELIIVFLAAIVTIAYHVNLYAKVRCDPLKTAIGIGNHARHSWVRGVMGDQRDILAVQILRNQVMAATFLASTAILISLGLLNAAFRPGIFSEISHRRSGVYRRLQMEWWRSGVMDYWGFFQFSKMSFRTKIEVRGLTESEFAKYH